MAAARQFLTRLLPVCVLLLYAAGCRAEFVFRNWDDPDQVKWEEKDYQLPAFPKDENLIEFYVSATATNKYFIDASSINIGKDDKVVRYVLVVKTAGGAKNVSYEGLRCDENQLRIYATGHTDGTWAVVRNSEWRPLRNLTLNQQQGALARNYFCPNAVPIYTAEEGRQALRLGKHPSAP